MPSNLDIYLDRCAVYEENNLLPESEGETRFLERFSEVLILDPYITNGKQITRNETLHGTRAITYGEL
jgi:hypothetical protein